MIPKDAIIVFVGRYEIHYRLTRGGPVNVFRSREYIR